jgi:regulator of protease activity HflC (stomatin/prohibitin superfamily)
VYTDCDHAAYVTDGINVKGVYEPGLGFTELFDRKPRTLDLRSQLRAFQVEALTKDGIPIRVLTFTPFRLNTNGQTAELGKPFPYDPAAIHTIVSRELVERKRKREESGEVHEWDGKLVPVIVTPIMRDIISKYNVDELCAPLDANRDPRVEIAAEMRKRAKEALLPMGIDLIGGGISNLIPDKGVIERRLDNWRTDWERKILAMMNENRAKYAGLIERARGDAEAETISRVIKSIGERGDQGELELTLRFFDCLGEIVRECDTQWPLPASTKATLKRLRGDVEARQR